MTNKKSRGKNGSENNFGGQDNSDIKADIDDLHLQNSSGNGEFARKKVIERVGDKENLAKLYSKLADATADIINLEKNGFNKYHNYEYAKADDIYLKVSRILAEKYNVQILTSTVNRVVNEINTDKGTYKEIFLEKRFSFNCGETGAHVSMDYWGYDVGKSGKFLYKAYTGCMKYFLKDNFMIDTGDPDPEMNEVSGKNNRSSQSVKNKNQRRNDEGGDDGLSSREKKVKKLIGGSSELKKELMDYLNHIKEENDLETVSINALTDEQFEEMIDILKSLKGVIEKSA